MNIRVRTSCRVCGSTKLTPVLDLGSQVLATAFQSETNVASLPTRPVPLQLVRCDTELDENACGVVQLRHSYPPNIMYSEYWYLSGVNQTMRTALADIVQSAQKLVQLKPEDTVVDIGCNDGTLLNSYEASNLDKVGFDPAQNLGSDADKFLRIKDFFNSASYLKARGEKRAKIVTSIAMFYDLEDPVTFAKDIGRILDPQGVWIVQMADLPNMLKMNMFDNICHEHLLYFHIAPFERVLQMAGMKLVDIEKNDINGSSYRFFIRRAEGPDATVEAKKRIYKEKLDEFNMALDTAEPYDKFRANIETNRKNLVDFLKRSNKEGKKTYVYGASTKGNVLLQYFGINNELISKAADRNPKKWGTRTLGTNIQIISEEEARASKPDYFLVLPYHFLPEMLKRETEFINRGGQFIVPVPDIQFTP
jgi:trans-aconitate methyltransferase